MQKKTAVVWKKGECSLADAKQDTKGITVKKSDDMAEWYGQVVVKSEIADYSSIRGFIIMRPNSYSIWEKIQAEFNAKIKKQRVRNAYFPLLIPESFFSKEAEHAKGFSPEVAWLEQKEGDHERYAIRPTSETIIYDSYARWIRSWRDLPLRLNQWCNIVRWEVKDTKAFLRGREFLWQEGHCVYETEKECKKETLLYLEYYRQVIEELLAVPVLVGRKTESERFAGAVRTLAIESLMPDGKALQMGTSHDLGQGFAKSFSISYLGKDGQMQLPWQNSWGFSTRTIGALIMTHGDEKGLVLPPRAAEHKLAIIPILFEASKTQTLLAARSLAKQLKRFNPILDDREEYSAGWKFNEYELTGIPLRIELGPKDIEKQSVMLVRRDTGEKRSVPIAQLADEIRKTLDEMQHALFDKAKKAMMERIVTVTDWDAFLAADKQGKMMLAAHCGNAECEQEIKETTKGITTRCIPFKGEKPTAACVRCQKKAKYNVYFARAY